MHCRCWQNNRLINYFFSSLGFLSVGFGIIADVDIESEHLRALGELRFTLWGLRRISHLRRYRARLSYLRADSQAQGSEGIKYADEDEEDQARVSFFNTRNRFF